MSQTFVSYGDSDEPSVPLQRAEIYQTISAVVARLAETRDVHGAAIERLDGDVANLVRFDVEAGLRLDRIERALALVSETLTRFATIFSPTADDPDARELAEMVRRMPSAGRE